MSESVYGFNGQTCMFCPNDIRREYGAKIIRKYPKALKQGKLLKLIFNATTDEDIPQEVKNEVSDMPDLQLYVDEYIEVAYAARLTSKTHLLISPVRHIEKFETSEDLDIIKKIIDAGWAIIRHTGLKDANLGISLKPGDVPIPHIHFHVNCDEVVNEEKLLELMEREYFYVRTLQR
jgi:diadenosine tetraphosphate (Ap4A) HIT family hydrolase